MWLLSHLGQITEDALTFYTSVEIHSTLMTTVKTTLELASHLARSSRASTLWKNAVVLAVPTHPCPK